MKEVKVGCIGCGTMGGAIIKGIAKQLDGKNIFVSNTHYEKTQKFAEENHVTPCKTNSEVCEKSDVLFIGVKPVYVEKVLGELNLNGKVVVSMAAGVKLENLEKWAKGAKSVIRIMPNIPAIYGEAMTAMCLNKAEDEDVSTVKQLLECCGKVEIVAEKMMDGVTAISGSGPAYVFMFIEALADAAVKFGIPRSQAYTYAAQTVKGSAVMALEDPRSISELKDAVCSPSGTTIDAVASLEENGFRGTVIKGATAAFDKSVSMSKK